MINHKEREEEQEIPMIGTVLLASCFAVLVGVASAMVGIWSVRKGTVPCRHGFIAKAEAPFIYWAFVVFWFGIGAAMVLLGIYMLLFPN